jgi:hypothetical protein
MNQYLGVALGAILITLGTALLVGGARHKGGLTSKRTTAMVGGLVCFGAGLLTTMFGFRGGGIPAPMTMAVLLSATLGCFIGYWHGHTSRRSAS